MNKDTTRLLQQLRSDLDALRQRISTMETSLDELQRQLESEAAAPEAAETEAVDLSAVAVGAFSEPEAAPEPIAEPEPVAEEAPVEDFPFPEPEVAPVASQNVHSALDAEQPRAERRTGHNRRFTKSFNAVVKDEKKLAAKGMNMPFEEESSSGKTVFFIILILLVLGGAVAYFLM